jgi:penicillin-binding protein-related factor A (putative recombinase)
VARNEFETEVGEFLKENFPMACRIDDVAMNRHGGRQVSKKPYDYYGSTIDGIIWVAEAKRVKSRSFTFGLFKEHQHAGQASCNGFSFVFLNFRVKSGGCPCGTAWWLPYQEFVNLIELARSFGRSSIAEAYIDKKFALKRKTGGWDVDDKHPLFCLTRDRSEDLPVVS